MTYEDAYKELVRRASDLIEFKKTRLSVVNGCEPILNVGPIDDQLIAPLRDFILSNDLKKLFPSKSFSFLKTSEAWIGGALNPSAVNPEIRKIVSPVLPVLRKLICEATGLDLIMMRAVIKTIDNESLILPHCDDFTSHEISIRTHVPILMIPECVGVNWHPETLEPKYWRTPVGSFYAFNNFEPHTLVKLQSEAMCALMIVDFMPAKLYNSSNHAEFMALRQATEGHAPGFSEENNPHGITHILSSLTIRNRLLSKAGFDAEHLKFYDHLKPEVVSNLREVVLSSALQAVAALDRIS